MPARTPMNSESLRAKFPEAYASFFIRHDLVTSALGAVSWGGIVGHRSKYLRTLVKIPLRQYVGVKKVPAACAAKFGNVTSLKAAQDGFETVPYEKVVPECKRVAEAVSEFLRLKKADFGVEISVFGESARGHGMGFSGTSSSALAIALCLLTKTVAPQDVGAGSDATGPSSEAFKLARKLDFIARYGNAVGDNVGLAMAEASVGFHWSKDFGAKLAIADLDAIQAGSSLLETGGQAVRISDLPVDVCVVFSGLPTRTKSVEAGRQADQTRLDAAVAAVAASTFGGKPPKFAAFCQFMKPGAAAEAFESAISVASLVTASLLTKLATDSTDRETVSDLIENANQHRGLGAAVERGSPFADELLRAFRNEPGGDRQIGVVPSYSGKMGGAYLVVMEAGAGRAALTGAVEKLRARHPDARVEYASWEDGDGKEGTAVEHWPAQSVRSSAVPQNCATFQDNRGKTYVASYAEIIDNERDCLLLDHTEMKIVVNGKRATSSDIPSQSAAVDILSALIAKPNAEVHNDELPSSSYSKDKAMMSSKVIAPLAAFAEKILKSPLPLSCHGTGGKFTIALGKTDLRVGSVSR